MPKWYYLIFFSVLFSNYEYGPILVTDLILFVFLFYTFFKTKNSNKTISLFSYVFFFLFLSLLNYVLYSHSRAFLSCIRFVFGLFVCISLYICYKGDNYRKGFVNGYLFSCVCFSAFLLIQFISYYVFNYNISISFGDNLRGEGGYFTDLYDPDVNQNYRTGGVFLEPSHFASFVAPSIFMLYSKTTMKQFFVVFAALLISTSGLGYVVMSIWGLKLLLSKGKSKSKLIIISLVSLTVLLLPMFFVRVSTGGSYEERIVNGYLILYLKDAISIIGVDPHILLNNDGTFVFWANTIQYLYIHYGVIGILVFLKFIFLRWNVFLFVVLFALIFIEGLQGRIDFWLMLFACKLYDYDMHCCQEKKIEIQKRHNNVISPLYQNTFC